MIILLQSLSLIFGLLGIGFALNGTLKLFKQFTVMREIKPSYSIEEQKNLEKEDLYRDVIAQINHEIRHSNKLNEDEYKHHKKLWLSQIIWGAVFSMISSVLSFTSLFFQC